MPGGVSLTARCWRGCGCPAGRGGLRHRRWGAEWDLPQWASLHRRQPLHDVLMPSVLNRDVMINENIIYFPSPRDVLLGINSSYVESVEVTLSATLLKKSTKPPNNNIYFDEEDRVSPEPEQHYNNQGTGSGAFHNGTGGGGSVAQPIFMTLKLNIHILCNVCPILGLYKSVAQSVAQHFQQHFFTTLKMNIHILYNVCPI